MLSSLSFVNLSHSNYFPVCHCRSVNNCVVIYSFLVLLPQTWKELILPRPKKKEIVGGGVLGEGKNYGEKIDEDIQG